MSERNDSDEEYQNQIKNQDVEQDNYEKNEDDEPQKKLKVSDLDDSRENLNQQNDNRGKIDRSDNEERDNDDNDHVRNQNVTRKVEKEQQRNVPSNKMKKNKDVTGQKKFDKSDQSEEEDQDRFDQPVEMEKVKSQDSLNYQKVHKNARNIGKNNMDDMDKDFQNSQDKEQENGSDEQKSPQQQIHKNTKNTGVMKKQANLATQSKVQNKVDNQKSQQNQQISSEEDNRNRINQSKKIALDLNDENGVFHNESENDINGLSEIRRRNETHNDDNDEQIINQIKGNSKKVSENQRYQFIRKSSQDSKDSLDIGNKHQAYIDQSYNEEDNLNQRQYQADDQQVIKIGRERASSSYVFSNSKTNLRNKMMQSVEHKERNNTNENAHLLGGQQSEQSQEEQLKQLLAKYQKKFEKTQTDVEKDVIMKAISQIKAKLIIVQNQNNEKQQHITQLKNKNQKKFTPKELIRQNLIEIYQFYAKQTYNLSKNITFDNILHINNVLSLGKFMYFCKDFKLTDLGYNLEDIASICEAQGVKVRIIKQSVQKKSNKYAVSQEKKRIADKSTLVETFKKCSSNSKELTFPEFEICISKIGNFVYQHWLDQLEVVHEDNYINGEDLEQIQPSSKDRKQEKPSALILLLLYLQILKPNEYRKKMSIVGLPFSMKDNIIEKITYDKIKGIPKPKPIIANTTISQPQVQAQAQPNLQAKGQLQGQLQGQSHGQQYGQSHGQQQLQQQNPSQSPQKYGKQPTKKVPEVKFEEFLEEDLVKKQIVKPKLEDQVTWDHLVQAKSHQMTDKFHPKDLLQDYDLEDQEDDIYLKEYQINKNEKNHVQNNHNNLNTQNNQITYQSDHMGSNQKEIVQYFKEPNRKESSRQKSIKDTNSSQLDISSDSPYKNSRENYGVKKVNGYSQKQQMNSSQENQREQKNILMEKPPQKIPYKGDIQQSGNQNKNNRQAQIGQETTARAQKLEEEQKKKEQEHFQTLMKNQINKEQRIQRKM